MPPPVRLAHFTPEVLLSKANDLCADRGIDRARNLGGGPGSGYRFELLLLLRGLVGPFDDWGCDGGCGGLGQLFSALVIERRTHANID